MCVWRSQAWKLQLTVGADESFYTMCVRARAGIIPIAQTVAPGWLWASSDLKARILYYWLLSLGSLVTGVCAWPTALFAQRQYRISVLCHVASFQLGVEGGKTHNQSSSWPCLSSVSSSPITIEPCLSCFNQSFHYGWHFLCGMAISGACGCFVTFGWAFLSFHLRRGKVGEVREERKLQVGNISVTVTSPLSLLTTPWAAILRGT